MPVLSVNGKIIPRNEATDTSGSFKYSKRKSVSRISTEYARWRSSDSYIKWRKIQWKKQKGLCFYCFHDLRIKKINVEHIVPRSKRGTNDYSNLVLACCDCNKSKGSAMPSERLLAYALSRNK